MLVLQEVKLFRYYSRLIPLGVKEELSLTLSEVADKLSSSLRHARNLLGQMQEANWLTWQPSVGRNQRSILTLHLGLKELQQIIALQFVEQGSYDKALEMLDGNQQWFGSLLKDTSGASQRLGELHLQLTYYRPFSRIVPHEPQRNSERFFLRQIYSCLVRCDADGHIEADLAHHWQHDSSAKCWKFYLRRGLTFHDGREITAPLIAQLITKLQEQSSYQQDLAHLASVTATREHTLVFELTQADLGFAGLLADPKYSIQPPSQLSTSSKRAIGSGPFQVVSHTKEKLHLQAFPHYYACRALTDEVTIWHVPTFKKKKLTLDGEASAVINDDFPQLPTCRQYLQCLDKEQGEASALDTYRHASGYDQASMIQSETQKALLEHGCVYLVFNQRQSVLTEEQRHWLRAYLAPKEILQAVGTTEDLQGLQAATNLLPVWTAVYTPLAHACPLPKKLSIAHYDQSDLRNAAQGIAKLLQDKGVETSTMGYSYEELQVHIRTDSVREDLVLTSTSLDDNRPASAYRWLYADPLLNNLLSPAQKEWLTTQLVAIRQTTSLENYLSAIEPLATAMINASWLVPLYHHKQTLRFQDVLQGVAITNWGWPEIKDVWIEN